jgi:hypothetical protein
MRRHLLVLLLCVMGVARAAPSSDGDIDRIPPGLLQPQDADPVAPDHTEATIYMEDTAEYIQNRTKFAVPVPGGAGPSGINRLFVDGRFNFPVGEALDVHLSDRFDFDAQNDQSFPIHQNLLNAFREGYVEYRADGGNGFLDLGRINVKNGVGYSFNPTDFFKARTVLDQFSADPQAQRVDRLGTFMLRAQEVFTGGSVTVIYAPRLADPAPLVGNLPSFRPDFNRTNADDRALAKVNYSLAEDFSPELLVLRQGADWRFGTNLTRGIGNNITAVLEWAGGQQRSLSADALRFGELTGAFPVGLTGQLGVDQRAAFRNDVATGFSFTGSVTSFIVEYDYHQAGFSRADWRNWFAMGQANNGPAWYIRAYAADQHVPMDRHGLFVWAGWYGITDLSLSAFAFVSPEDGSVGGQVEADYRLSNNWSVGLMAEPNLGGKRTERGSYPNAANVIFTVTRLF